MKKEQMALLLSYQDLFKKKAFAHIATIMKDGSPQVTPVWVDFDGTLILINTAKGRQKYLNILRDPRVALSIQDPDDPFRKLLVRGKVIELTENGADEHIDHLALRYTGVAHYQRRTPGMVRVIIKIKPLHVSG